MTKDDTLSLYSILYTLPAAMNMNHAKITATPDNRGFLYRAEEMIMIDSMNIRNMNASCDIIMVIACPYN